MNLSTIRQHRSESISECKSRNLEITISMMMLMLIFLQYRSEMLFRVLKYPLFLLGTLLLCLVLNGAYIQLRNFLIYVFFLASGMINMTLVGNVNKFTLVKVFIVSFSIALFFQVRKKQPVIAWTCLTALLWCYVLLSFFTSNGYNVFYSTSRNYISVFSLLLIFILTIMWNNNGQRLPFIFCILFFLSCIIAVGRGGIITGAILVTLSGLRELKAADRYRPAIICAMAAVFIAALLLMDPAVYERLVGKVFSRFVDAQSTGSNNERMFIYTTYIEKILKKPSNLLLGVNTLDINAVISQKGGNLHNSYLQFHACMGLIPLIALFFFIIHSIRYLVKTRQYDHLFIFIVFLIRSSLDHCFTGEIGDIIMIYYIMMPLAADPLPVNCGETGLPANE